MEGDGFDDFFDALSSGQLGPLPEPTPEDLRREAMTATELHIQAFEESVAKRDKEYEKMLPIWAEELAYYLPILEDHEEYEQCQKVFDAQKTIKAEYTNIKLNKELRDLKIEDKRPQPEPEPEDDGELDF